MTQAKITITRTRRGLGFPDTQRYVKRAAAAAQRIRVIDADQAPDIIENLIQKAVVDYCL